MKRLTQAFPSSLVQPQVAQTVWHSTERGSSKAPGRTMLHLQVRLKEDYCFSPVFTQKKLAHSLLIWVWKSSQLSKSNAWWMPDFLSGCWVFFSILVRGPKPLIAEFGIHHRLESCELDPKSFFLYLRRVNLHHKHEGTRGGKWKVEGGWRLHFFRSCRVQQWSKRWCQKTSERLTQSETGLATPPFDQGA